MTKPTREQSTEWLEHFRRAHPDLHTVLIADTLQAEYEGRIRELEAERDRPACPKHPHSHCERDSHAGLVCERCELEAEIAELEAERDLLREALEDAAVAMEDASKMLVSKSVASLPVFQADNLRGAAGHARFVLKGEAK